MSHTHNQKQRIVSPILPSLEVPSARVQQLGLQLRHTHLLQRALRLVRPFLPSVRKI